MEYKCHKCNKLYSSYQSLWIHNKKYHNPQLQDITNIDCKSVQKLTENKIFCKYCSKVFTRKNNMVVHMNKTCKEKTKKETILQEELDKVKQELSTIKTGKLDIKNNINNSSINNGSINNGTIINKNIIKFGSEDIKNILTEKQIEKIVNCRLLALEESIRQVHFNKDKPEYQNIKINNLRSNVALVHDGERFNVTNQYSAISSLIDNHVESIEQILDDKKTSLPIRTVEKLEMLISKLENNYKKIIDEESNRSFKNYKDYKVDTVKQMIYNKSRELDDLDKIKS